jgi:hypothetical protein
VVTIVVVVVTIVVGGVTNVVCLCVLGKRRQVGEKVGGRG